MSDARSIVEALGGRWSGRGGLCFCPAHDNSHTPALSVSEADDGRLLLHCHAGCAFTDIVDALRDRGILNGSGGRAHSRPLPDLDRRRMEIQRARFICASGARAIWEGARPIESTRAEVYLRARGITGPLPDSLRFHDTLRHPDSIQPRAGMVARVDGGNGFAIHRTFLGSMGSVKASAKMMLGPVAGGGVRVADGPGALVVAEGIETALSVARMLPEHGPVWAALSTSGVRGFRLPEIPGRLIVAVDGDAPGREAGRALGDRACAAGWAVEWADPGDGLDWNDVLMTAQQKGMRA